MRAKRASRPRGMSLLELVISSAIVIITLSTATMGFLAQNRSLYALELTREANAAGRDALLSIEASLRRLGWGVPPGDALDLTRSCMAPSPGCRDRRDGPDQLAFVAREPRYHWRANGEDGCITIGGCFAGRAWAIDSVVDATNVTVTLRPGDLLERGRVVLAMCADGANPVMLTLSQRYDTPGSTRLEPYATPALPYNNPAGIQSCHADGGLFVIDSHRYFIETYDSVPWLMLDTGLDLDDDGSLPPSDTDDLVPIARDVEDLQVAYVIPPTGVAAAPDSNNDWVLGNDKVSITPEEPDRSLSPADYYALGDDDPVRYRKAPGNIRGVRVTLTLRSHRRDGLMPDGWPGETLDGAENNNVDQGGLGRRRYRYETAVHLRNLEARAPFTF